MRHSLYMWLLFFIGSAALAAEPLLFDSQSHKLGRENRQLSQKLTMAGYLLNNASLKSRIDSSNSLSARQLFETAHDDYSQVLRRIETQNWLEANAIIDSVLRNLSRAAQLLSENSMLIKRYRENLKRVESFVLPQWSTPSPASAKRLEQSLARVNQLIAMAGRLAESKNYKKANDKLDAAYRLKAELLSSLDHQTTVVYDLNFESVEEEYDYLLQRSEHYRSLVDHLLSENSFSAPMTKSINGYLVVGNSGIVQARSRAQEKSYIEAIDILKRSIADFTAALKIAGIRI